MKLCRNCNQQRTYFCRPETREAVTMPLGPSVLAGGHLYSHSGLDRALNGSHSSSTSEHSTSPRSSPYSMGMVNGGLPPLRRPILPIRKSNTSPLSYMTSERTDLRPPISPMPKLSRASMFYAKPLREVHSVSRVQSNPGSDGRILVSKSPSPAFRRNGSMSNIETGRITDLPGRKNSFAPTIISRSPSPLSCLSSIRSSSSQYSTCSSYHAPARSMSVCSTRVGKSPTPRRIFPQTCDDELGLDIEELRSKEQAPVVFDANLTFVLGCENQKVRQNIRPVAAHLDDSTASNYLSAKIEDFLKRTDHVMDEWRNLGHKDDEMDLGLTGANGRRLGRSRSAANIMIKGFQYFSKSGSLCRSNSHIRDFSEDRTISEADEVNMTRIIPAPNS